MQHHYASPALQASKGLQLALETLTPKERSYIELRLQGALPNAAARAAGLEPAATCAQRLEKDERVRMAMQYSVRVQAYHMDLTRDDVINGLLDALPMAATATEIVAVWREVGKIIGAYAPVQHEHNHKHELTQEKLGEMSDAELADLAALEGEYQVLDFDENYTDPGDPTDD